MPDQTETAEDVVAALEAEDRATANLRNAVALPDDDPRGRDMLVGKALDTYTRALVKSSEAKSTVLANAPVGADVEPVPDGPEIEPPIARVEPDPDAPLAGAVDEGTPPAP